MADPQSWGGIPTCFVSGANGTAIGTGEKNTADIVATKCANDGIPARLAADYSESGESDWFLPSADEMNALCKWAYGDTVYERCNTLVIPDPINPDEPGNAYNGGFSLTYGNFTADNITYYKTSSKFRESDFSFIYLNFGNGGKSIEDYSARILFAVRPIRAF